MADERHATHTAEREGGGKMNKQNIWTDEEVAALRTVLDEKEAEIKSLRGQLAGAAGLKADTRKLARQGLNLLGGTERSSDEPTWRHHMDRIDAAIAEIDAMATVGGQQ